MHAKPVVEIKDMTVRYGRFTAVEDLSLAVEKGCVYALLGRNGSGKSSTVRCLLGQWRAAGGSSRLFGLDSWRQRTRIMTRVGVVPEQPDIPPETTAERLATFMVRVAPRWRSQSFFDRLDGFGVPRSRAFDKLSKGQQRQMGLALALAHSPELLVLDDPTLGLDAVARRELFEELIGDLADRGTTVFLTTHDLAGVEGIADRIGVLKGGDLLVDEHLESLKARFCRITYAGAEGVSESEIRDGLQPLGVIGTTETAGTSQATVEDFSEVAFGRFREKVSVEVTAIDSMPLEEIFIALCGENGGGR